MTPPEPERPPPEPLVTWREGWRGQVDAVLFVLAAFGWLLAPMLTAFALATFAPRWLGLAAMIAALLWLFGLLVSLALSKTAKPVAVRFLLNSVPRWIGVGVGLAAFALIAPAALENEFGVTLPLPAYWQEISRSMFSP